MTAFFGKSGNLSLLSYSKYAESKNVSYQIFISRESLQFSLLKWVLSECTYYKFSYKGRDAVFTNTSVITLIIYGLISNFIWM